jgi:hypothetical protein
MKTETTLIFVVIVAVLVGAQAPPDAQERAPSSLVDPCRSTARVEGVLPATWLACPRGDGQGLVERSVSIRIAVYDPSGWPVAGVPASDFWLIDCDPVNDIVLCGGSASCDADSATNAQGMTSFSTSALAAGGCADGLSVVVQGYVIEDSLTTCTTAQCLPLNVRSPDIDGDLSVGLADLVLLNAAYYPNPYDPCADLDGDGYVDLRDLSYFALHWQHRCD